MSASAGAPADPSVTSVHVSIGKEGARALLAVQGAAINRVRRESGAKVKLHDADAATGERMLEISGSAAQVQAAQSMVAEALSHAAAAGL